MLCIYRKRLPYQKTFKAHLLLVKSSLICKIHLHDTQQLIELHLIRAFILTFVDQCIENQSNSATVSIISICLAASNELKQSLFCSIESAKRLYAQLP